jgi:hypothetical protein
MVLSRKWPSASNSRGFGHSVLTASPYSYIFMNLDNSRDWALHKASVKTVHKFSSLIKVLLLGSAGGLVRNVSFVPCCAGAQRLTATVKRV